MPNKYYYIHVTEYPADGQVSSRKIFIRCDDDGASLQDHMGSYNFEGAEGFYESAEVNVKVITDRFNVFGGAERVEFDYDSTVQFNLIGVEAGEFGDIITLPPSYESGNAFPAIPSWFWGDEDGEEGAGAGAAEPTGGDAANEGEASGAVGERDGSDEGAGNGQGSGGGSGKEARETTSIKVAVRATPEPTPPATIQVFAVFGAGDGGEASPSATPEPNPNPTFYDPNQPTWDQIIAGITGDDGSSLGVWAKFYSS